MDSITQGLLGATIGECGFRHKLGRGATLMAGIGGVLPDLDIVVGWLDPWWTWQYHRHFTHSVFFAPLVAAPLAWLFWRRHDRRTFGLWFLCAYLALATHPLLDLLTTYGTELFAPVSNLRLGLDWIAIIDPLYSLVLAATLIACAVSRRRGRSAKTWRIGAGGMALSMAYLGYGAWNHGLAMDRIHEHARRQGHSVAAARAIPSVGSVFVWRLIYLTDSCYHVGRTNTRFDKPPSFHKLPMEDHPLIDKADVLPRVELFRNFTMGWARPMVRQTPDGWTVVYDDLRYSWPPDRPQSFWSVVVTFDRSGKVTDVQRASHRRRDEASTADLWHSFWRELREP